MRRNIEQIFRVDALNKFVLIQDYRSGSAGSQQIFVDGPYQQS